MISASSACLARRLGLRSPRSMKLAWRSEQPARCARSNAGFASSRWTATHARPNLESFSAASLRRTIVPSVLLENLAVPALDDSPMTQPPHTQQQNPETWIELAAHIRNVVALLQLRTGRSKDDVAHQPDRTAD